MHTPFSIISLNDFDKDSSSFSEELGINFRKWGFAYGVYRSKVRPVIENPDSQFVAMPQSITPAGIELNPSTEPIEDPTKQTVEPVIEEIKPNN